MSIENHSSNGEILSPGSDSHHGDAISGASGAGRHRNTRPGISHFLLRIASWIASEVLAGCAAYGEAMYPMYTRQDEQSDSNDPARSQQTAEVIQIKRESESRNLSHIQSRKGRLKS